MAKTIQEEFLYKKTYEFSYAVLMVASSAKNKDIGALLESKSISLLDSVLTADYAKTKDIINSIISLARIMVDGGLLHPMNREVLIKESGNIYSAIEAISVLPKKEIPLELNLNKAFSKSSLPTSPVRSNPTKRSADAQTYLTSNGVKRQIADNLVKQPVQSEIIKDESEIANNDSAKLITEKIADEIADRNYNEAGFFKSEMRQSAIINKLQQIGNLPGQPAGCRLNELQELFPNVSERTLRYDIESSISKGLVERIGSRRNSVYQLKNRSGTVIELPSSPTAQNPGF